MPPDTRYVAVLHLPFPIPALTPEDIRAHVTWLKTLEDQGRLELAGPFADGRGGMVIFRADNLAEAQALAASDPFVERGLRRLELREWYLSRAENRHMGMG
jgi:uncharacterized protein YciI